MAGIMGDRIGRRKLAGDWPLPCRQVNAPRLGHSGLASPSFKWSLEGRMLDKLHKLLFTTLLLVFVGIVLWWTLFLRERFSGSELALQAKEERIEELARSLEAVEAERGELTGELEAARADLVARDRTIAEQAGTIDEQGRAIDALETDLEATREELAASEAEVRALEAALRLLKVDRRLARVEVVRREDTPEGPRTHLRFVEIGPDGLPAGEPRQFSVAGTRVYFEALVIKFDDQYAALVRLRESIGRIVGRYAKFQCTTRRCAVLGALFENGCM